MLPPLMISVIIQFRLICYSYNIADNYYSQSSTLLTHSVSASLFVADSAHGHERGGGFSIWKIIKKYPEPLRLIFCGL